MQDAAERRRHRRYDLSLPVRVRPKAGEAPVVVGSSRDISAGGIYFTVLKDFDVESEMEFELNLPPEISQGKDVRILCTAKIERVDRMEKEDRIGIAASIEKYKFIRKD